LGLFDALKNARDVGDLSPRAQSAISKFVTMVEGWRRIATGESVGGLLGGTEKAAFAELVERIVRESGLEPMYRQSKSEEDLDRLENLNELINAAAEFSAPQVDAFTGEASIAESSILSTLQAYLESVALVSDADAIDPANGAVTL